MLISDLISLGEVMKIHKDHPIDNPSTYSVDTQESEEVLSHRRRTRKMLEDRLERKRLRQELDDFDSDLDDMEDEFDWHDDPK